MSVVALLGAGGKMGFRLSANLKSSDFEVRHIEISEAGRTRLQDELGVSCVDVAEGVPGADVVILAVPDNLIGRISKGIEPMLESGTMLVALDAAAPFAGHLPDRDDLTYFVTHPCHPPIFNDETDLEAKRDYFGGIKAKQNIVNALMQGPEDAYELGERIARTIYAPVVRSHRVSVEHMALLEPGLSETVCATFLAVMREAMDEVVARGVSEQAARDFLLGHMNILGAVIFNETEGVFSDACNKAIEFAKPQIFREDWKRIFEPEEIADSIRRIT
jgi:hypothetical protein